jgi:hypothetical protein
MIADSTALDDSMMVKNNSLGGGVYSLIKQINSGALVRQRTIPTERPPPVGEVSANFSG